MKQLINKFLANCWCFKHTIPAYLRYYNEMIKNPIEGKYNPLEQTPTEAIRILLEWFDGQEADGNVYQFLMVCKREYEWRQRINKED